MDDITNKLIAFSDKFDLWTKTKDYGLKCLQTYLADGTAKELGNIDGLVLEDFVFSKKDQQLIFFSYSEKSFILRTTYSLETKLADGKIIIGHYSLDIDKNGEVSDDWLTFM